MKIFLHNYKISVKTAMQMCGYTFREDKGDYIREEQGGRFHAHKIASQVIDIHYDLYVDWKHVTFPMPLKARAERFRIFKRLLPVRDHEMTAEMLSKLHTKHSG